MMSQMNNRAGTDSLTSKKGHFSSDAGSRTNKQGNSCTTGCNKGAPVVTHTQTLANTKRTPHTFTQGCVYTYMLLVLPQSGVQTGHGKMKHPEHQVSVWCDHRGKWGSESSSWGNYEKLPVAMTRNHWILLLDLTQMLLTKVSVAQRQHKP